MCTCYMQMDTYILGWPTHIGDSELHHNTLLALRSISKYIYLDNIHRWRYVQSEYIYIYI